jgi:hypothetical protein
MLARESLCRKKKPRGRETGGKHGPAGSGLAGWQESSWAAGGRRHAAASLAVRSSEKQPARARPHSLRPIFACHRRPLHHFPPCVRECSHALSISLRPVDLLAPRSDRAQTTKTNDTTSDDDAPTSLPYPPQHHLSSRRCYSPAGTHAALHAVYPHSL